MRHIRFNTRHRDTLIGLFFVAPFLIGAAVFFMYPLLSSLLLSFGDTDQSRGGFHIVLGGLSHYYEAFLGSTQFVPLLLGELKRTAFETPLILVFSLLLAIMLNRVGRLRGFFRVILLLPFLLGTGEVMKQLLSQNIDTQIINIAGGDLIPRDFLLYLGADIVSALDSMFGVIVKVLWNSGVQTLLFLSAIQSISPALYESAKMDGANEYEQFWKITLPMTSQVLLLNLIYTIINSFTDSSNTVLEHIQNQTVAQAKFGYAAALGWIYFALILLILGAVGLIFGLYARKNQTIGRNLK